MRTPAGFVQWCLEHPTDSAIAGASWDQKCASLVFRAGGFWSSFTSAYKAGLYTRNAHGLSSSKTPPLGWMVYFDIGGVNNGHIGMSMGDGTFLNANWRAHPMTPAHKALGVLGIQEYINASGATYMGASPYYGDATLELSVTAADTSAPLEEIEMPLSDEDAQTVVKTQIILDPRWGQASLAETVSATRTRAEDIIASANRIEDKLDRLLKVLNG